MSSGMHVTPGAFVPAEVEVWYTGTDVLKPGYPVCRDVNAIFGTTTGIGIGGNSRTIPAEQSGISAAKPTFANLKYFLGVVAESNSHSQLRSGVAGRAIKIIPRWAYGSGVSVWCDTSVAVGDLLGIQPNSFAFTIGGVFDGQIYARAEEAQDRSSTAGKVKCEFGQINMTPTEYGEKVQVYDNDFMEFDSNEIVEAWTTTETGAGTEALADAVGGELLLTNAAADDDAIFMQQKGEKWKLASNKPLFFGARFKVSDATQSDFVMGLCVTDTTPLAAQDNVYFRKDDGDANVDFNTDKDATQTDADTTLDAVSAQYMYLAFFFNGNGTVYAYGVTSATAANVNFAALALLLTHTTNIVNDEELTITLGIQNGEAVAKTMNIDRITVRQAK